MRRRYVFLLVTVGLALAVVAQTAGSADPSTVPALADQVETSQAELRSVRAAAANPVPLVVAGGGVGLGVGLVGGAVVAYRRKVGA